jgi:hypothetical protein
LGLSNKLKDSVVDPGSRIWIFSTPDPRDLGFWTHGSGILIGDLGWKINFDLGSDILYSIWDKHLRTYFRELRSKLHGLKILYVFVYSVLRIRIWDGKIQVWDPRWTIPDPGSEINIRICNTTEMRTIP